MANPKIDTLNRGPKGRFVKKGTPGTNKEVLARGPGGRFLPKSALSEVITKLAETNKGHTLANQGGFQLSDLAKMNKSDNMMHPKIIESTIKNSIEDSKQILTLLRQQTQIHQKTYTALTGDGKILHQVNDKMAEMFGIDMVESSGALKHITKQLVQPHTQINTHVLQNGLFNQRQQIAESQLSPFGTAVHSQLQQRAEQAKITPIGHLVNKALAPKDPPFQKDTGKITKLKETNKTKESAKEANVQAKTEKERAAKEKRGEETKKRIDGSNEKKKKDKGKGGGDSTLLESIGGYYLAKKLFTYVKPLFPFIARGLVAAAPALGTAAAAAMLGYFTVRGLMDSKKARERNDQQNQTNKEQRQGTENVQRNPTDPNSFFGNNPGLLDQYNKLTTPQDKEKFLLNNGMTDLKKAHEMANDSKPFVPSGPQAIPPQRTPEVVVTARRPPQINPGTFGGPGQRGDLITPPSGGTTTPMPRGGNPGSFGGGGGGAPPTSIPGDNPPSGGARSGVGRGGGQVGGPPIRSSGNLAANQKEAYQAAVAEGLSPAAAKVLVANMSGESLADPSNSHWDVHHNSQGIVQWDPERSAAIKAHFGKEPKDMTVSEQTKAAIWEMKTNPAYKPSWTALNDESKSADEKMRAVVGNYERPADVAGATAQRMRHHQGLNVDDTATAQKSGEPPGQTPTAQGSGSPPGENPVAQGPGSPTATPVSSGRTVGPETAPTAPGEPPGQTPTAQGPGSPTAIPVSSGRAVIDDSIGVDIGTASGARTNTVAGAHSDQTLESIKNMKDEDIKGKNITLSRGASNNPADLSAVSKQIDGVHPTGAGYRDLAGTTSNQQARSQGPTPSRTGNAIQDATKMNQSLQEAKNAPTAAPVINAPTNISPQTQQKETRGNIVPPVRNDDPTFLQALRGDIKYA